MGGPESLLVEQVILLVLSCFVVLRLILSYPLCLGTHWVLEIVSMLIRRRATHTGKINVLDLIPTAAMDAIPSPRLFMTHLRFHQLPEQFRKNRSKIVYCVRNPKDVAVSLFNFTRAYRDMQYSGTWEQFLKEFCRGNGKEKISTALDKPSFKQN